MLQHAAVVRAVNVLVPKRLGFQLDVAYLTAEDAAAVVVGVRMLDSAGLALVPEEVADVDGAHGGR